MEIGDIATFGSFDWHILEIKKDRMLLLTKDIIELRDYHNKVENITWKDCELRQYLNESFYYNFDESDRDRVIETMNSNPDNLWYKSIGGEDTSDKIFLLSMDEIVRTYFGDSSRLLDYPGKNQRYWFQRKDVNNTKRRAVYLDSIWWWWTRTPGKNNRVTVYIHGDGNIGIQGNGISKRNTNVIHPSTHDNRGGIRPALWVKK